MTPVPTTTKAKTTQAPTPVPATPTKAPTPVPPTTTKKPTPVPPTTTKAQPQIKSEIYVRRVVYEKEDDLWIQTLTLKNEGGRIFYAGVGYEDDDEMVIFEIDAVTGYIIKWLEIDLDDDDDDWDDDDWDDDDWDDDDWDD